MLKLAFLLAAAAAQPAPIETFEQARDVCASLAQKADSQAGQLLRVEVPSKGFVFGRHRASDGEIELDGDRPLRAAKGTLLLDIDAIDEVAFKATDDQVAEWRQLKDQGALFLRIDFRPAQRCAGSKFARQFRLAGRADSWRLVGPQGRSLAAADDEGKPLARPDGGHAAKVTSVAFDGEPPQEDEGRGKLADSQRALDDCARGARGPGRVVVSFSAKGGAVRDVQVVLDGVRDATVTACIARALSSATVDGAGRATASIAVE